MFKWNSQGASPGTNRLPARGSSAVWVVLSLKLLSKNQGASHVVVAPLSLRILGARQSDVSNGRSSLRLRHTLQPSHPHNTLFGKKPVMGCWRELGLATAVRFAALRGCSAGEPSIGAVRRGAAVAAAAVGSCHIA